MFTTRIAFAIAFSAVLALAGCGGSSSKSAPTGTGASTTSSASKSNSSGNGSLPAGCEQLSGGLGSCMTIAITGDVTKHLTTSGTSGIVGQTCADWAANRNKASSDEPTWFKLPTPTGTALTEVQSDLAVSDYTGPGTYGADKVTGNTGGQLTIGSQNFKFDSATSTAAVTIKADGSGSMTLGKLSEASGGGTAVDYDVTWTCVG